MREASVWTRTGPTVEAEPGCRHVFGTPPLTSRLALRFRPSEQARTWQRGAHGERRTARLLDRLTRDGFVVFHDLAVPGSPANIDCDDSERGGRGEV